MAEIDYKEALKIHGIACSDSDSDVDGNRELDEEYNLLKPPPLDLNDKDVVVIYREETRVVNFWEDRMMENESEDDKDIQTEDHRKESSPVTILPVKKKKKKSKASKVTNADINNKNGAKLKVQTCKSNDIKEIDINAHPVSEQQNSVVEFPIMEPNSDISAEFNTSETVKENEMPIPENSELENTDISEKVTSGVNGLSVVEHWNILQKMESDTALPGPKPKENQVKKKKKKQKQLVEEPTCSQNVSNETSVENDMKKTSEDKKKEEKKTNDGNVQLEDDKPLVSKAEPAKMSQRPNLVPPTTPVPYNRTHINQLEHIFGDDFKDFIQSLVRGGTSVADLNSFTYEQLFCAYQAHQQKARNNATWNGVPVRNAWVQPTGPPPHRPLYQQTYMYPANLNANVAFFQNNVNWPPLGNNTYFPNNSFQIPTLAAAPVPANMLKVKEVKQNGANPPNAAATQPKQQTKTEKENKVQETKGNSGAEGVQPVAETSKVSSAQDNSAPMENDNSNMKKKKQKGVTDEPLDGSALPLDGGTVPDASQGCAEEPLKIKSVQSSENFFYSKNFDTALNSFIQEFKEGAKMIVEAATQTKKYVNIPGFGQCKSHITDLLKMTENLCLVIKYCLEICALISKETNKDDTTIDVRRKKFATEFQCYGRILKWHMEEVSNCEDKILDIYQIMYNKLIRYVIMVRVGLLKCSQTCDTIVDEIKACGWIETNETEIPCGNKESGRLAPCLGDPNRDVKSPGEEESSASSSDRNHASERLLLGLGLPNGSLKSSTEADGETPATRPLETKEKGCGGGGSTNDDKLGENLTPGISAVVRKYVNVDKIAEQAVYHSKGLDSDLWWCHALFLTLVAYILIAAVQGVVTYVGDHFLHAALAFFLYTFMKNTR